ncbi:MAG TPA: hypothetical protein VFN97_23415 [Actinospica sp.]|nr:hypothetical protein [Actinospica sp.]
MLLLALVTGCVVIPLVAAVLNGFLPGLGQHATQAQPIVTPTPQLVSGHGYQATAASETVFGRLGPLGITAILAIVVLGVVLLRLRKRRPSAHEGA